MPRANAGFTIIDSIFVGDSEFVLGVNNANPAMYVEKQYQQHEGTCQQE